MPIAWKFLICGATLLASTLVSAQTATPTNSVKVNDVDGASSFTIDTTTAVTTIVGGLGGAACVGDTLNVCSSCTAGSLTACNAARVYDSLILRITLTVEGDNVGHAPIITKNDAVAGDTGITQASGSADTEVRITWANICANAFADAQTSCENIDSALTGSLKITIDKDDNGQLTAGETSVTVNFKVVKPPADYDLFGNPHIDGVGGFIPYPGDEKFYLEDTDTSTNFPSSAYNARFTAVRVFASKVNMTQAAPGVADTIVKDLAVSSNDTDLRTNVFDGLENGMPYVVRVAVVDEAGNVVQFFPGAGVGDCDTRTPPAPLDGAGGGCQYAVIPDQVLGLLTEDMNCFVATAAFGSSLEPELRTFRDFRYKVLLPTTWGRWFVMSYYEYGPYAARFIHDKPVLRAATRAALWPLYLFSRLALSVGMLQALGISLAGLAMMIALPWYGVRRARRG